MPEAVEQVEAVEEVEAFEKVEAVEQVSHGDFLRTIEESAILLSRLNVKALVLPRKPAVARCAQLFLGHGHAA